MGYINLHLHPKQSVAFKSPATEILYGGAAGGGKSHLMRVWAINMCFRVKGLQVYLFRRLSDDLIRSHMEGAGGFYELLGYAFENGSATFNAAKNVIKFKNGSRIWLCHCQYEKDLTKYFGCEIHVLLIDELTHFTEKMYRFLRSRLRLGTLQVPDDLKQKLPMVLCGSNPGSVGHLWVKRTFVSSAQPFDVYRTDKEEGAMLRQFIPARLDDNPSLDRDDYEGKLSGLGTPEMVRAMLEGDWDMVLGGALDDVWSRQFHVIPRFAIPHGWRKDRSFDYGSAAPFHVGWWARANGEEVRIPADGIRRKRDTIFCPVAGSLICFHEWYGAKAIDKNEGLKLGSTTIAKGILEREEVLRRNFWITGQIFPGAADNSIFSDTDKDVECIARKMAKEGVLWKRSNKSPGSRKTGLQLFRDRLYAAISGEGKAIYFMEHCHGLISTLPPLPRDEKDLEDVDTKAIDHPYDSGRYRILDEDNPLAGNIAVQFPT